MDMYSFGLVCCWLLFDKEKSFQNRDCGSGNESILESAHRFTLEQVELDNQRRRNLLQLFDRTLAEDPNLRSSEFVQILELLSLDR